MECLVLKRKKTKVGQLVTLSTTRAITPEDTRVHAKWQILEEWYKAVEQDPNHEWVDKAVMSIINAIVYQERVYFCLERENVRELLSKDKNWVEPIGLSNGIYGTLIAELIDRNFITLHDDSKRPSIYKVCDKTLLEMVKVESEDEQLAQVLEFVNKNSKNSSDGCVEPKQVQVSENIEDSLFNPRTDNADGYSDVEKKKIRKEEKKANTETFSFKDLLYREITNLDLREISQSSQSLADLAVENCQDFDTGNYNLKILESFLVQKCHNKPSKAQKEFIQNIVSGFKFHAEKALSFKNNQNIELKQPKPTDVKSVIADMDTEQVSQGYTLNVLKASFGKEKLEKLNQRLDRSQDSAEKAVLEKEIQYWQNIIYGKTGE
jgi:hypothetical protein